MIFHPRVSMFYPSLGFVFKISNPNGHMDYFLNHKCDYIMFYPKVLSSPMSLIISYVFPPTDECNIFILPLPILQLWIECIGGSLSPPILRWMLFAYGRQSFLSSVSISQWLLLLKGVNLFWCPTVTLDLLAYAHGAIFIYF